MLRTIVFIIFIAFRVKTTSSHSYSDFFNVAIKSNEFIPATDFNQVKSEIEFGDESSGSVFSKIRPKFRSLAPDEEHNEDVTEMVTEHLPQPLHLTSNVTTNEKPDGNITNHFIPEEDERSNRRQFKVRAIQDRYYEDEDAVVEPQRNNYKYKKIDTADYSDCALQGDWQPMAVSSNKIQYHSGPKHGHHHHHQQQLHPHPTFFDPHVSGSHKVPIHHQSQQPEHDKTYLHEFASSPHIHQHVQPNHHEKFKEVDESKHHGKHQHHKRQRPNMNFLVPPPMPHKQRLPPNVLPAPQKLQQIYRNKPKLPESPPIYGHGIVSKPTNLYQRQKPIEQPPATVNNYRHQHIQDDKGSFTCGKNHDEEKGTNYHTASFQVADDSGEDKQPNKDQEIEYDEEAELPQQVHQQIEQGGFYTSQEPHQVFAAFNVPVNVLQPQVPVNTNPFQNQFSAWEQPQQRNPFHDPNLNNLAFESQKLNPEVAINQGYANVHRNTQQEQEDGGQEGEHGFQTGHLNRISGDSGGHQQPNFEPDAITFPQFGQPLANFKYQIHHPSETEQEKEEPERLGPQTFQGVEQEEAGDHGDHEENHGNEDGFDREDRHDYDHHNDEHFEHRPQEENGEEEEKKVFTETQINYRPQEESADRVEPNEFSYKVPHDDVRNKNRGEYQQEVNEESRPRPHRPRRPFIRPDEEQSHLEQIPNRHQQHRNEELVPPYQHHPHRDEEHRHPQSSEEFHHNPHRGEDYPHHPHRGEAHPQNPHRGEEYHHHHPHRGEAHPQNPHRVQQSSLHHPHSHRNEEPSHHHSNRNEESHNFHHPHREEPKHPYRGEPHQHHSHHQNEGSLHLSPPPFKNPGSKQNRPYLKNKHKKPKKPYEKYEVMEDSGEKVPPLTSLFPPHKNPKQFNNRKPNLALPKNKPPKIPSKKENGSFELGQASQKKRVIAKRKPDERHKKPKPIKVSTPVTIDMKNKQVITRLVEVSGG